MEITGSLIASLLGPSFSSFLPHSSWVLLVSPPQSTNCTHILDSRSILGGNWTWDKSHSGCCVERMERHHQVSVFNASHVRNVHPSGKSNLVFPSSDREAISALVFYTHGASLQPALPSLLWAWGGHVSGNLLQASGWSKSLMEFISVLQTLVYLFNSSFALNFTNWPSWAFGIMCVPVSLFHPDC